MHLIKLLFVLTAIYGLASRVAADSPDHISVQFVWHADPSLCTSAKERSFLKVQDPKSFPVTGQEASFVASIDGNLQMVDSGCVHIQSLKYGGRADDCQVETQVELRSTAEARFQDFKSRGANFSLLGRVGCEPPIYPDG